MPNALKSVPIHVSGVPKHNLAQQKCARQHVGQSKTCTKCAADSRCYTKHQNHEKVREGKVSRVYNIYKVYILYTKHTNTSQRQLTAHTSLTASSAENCTKKCQKT